MYLLNPGFPSKAGEGKRTLGERRGNRDAWAAKAFGLEGKRALRETEETDVYKPCLIRVMRNLTGRASTAHSAGGEGV